MANIKFSYLYRDGANYKNFGEIVFENPDNIDLTELETIVRSKLIDETWFYANKWLVPDLHMAIWNDEIDHTFHEFEYVSSTKESVNSQISLSKFMATLSKL